MLNKIVENYVSKVENFTLFGSVLEIKTVFCTYINILDRFFHIGKKKPLQLIFSCKGFLFTFCFDFQLSESSGFLFFLMLKMKL